MQVQLSRDALSTPWGFRLQGGKDFKAPLTVQRVFVGSPAEGELHRGDVIVGIDNYDATQMIHKQAQDLIKSSGGSITLTVKRGYSSGASSRPLQHTYAPVTAPTQPRSYGPSAQCFRSRSLDVQPARGNMPPAPQNNSFGVDYNRGRMNRPQTGTMLNRVQDSLNATLLEPGAHQGEELYDYKPVSELTNIFRPKSNAPARYHHPHHPQHTANHHPSGHQENGDEVEEPRKSVSELKSMYNRKGLGMGAPSRGGWKRPDPATTGGVGSGLKEPGWSPGMSRASGGGQPQQRGGGGGGAGGWSPVKAPGGAAGGYSRPAPVPVNAAPQQPAVNRPQHHHHQQYQPPPHIEEPSVPAWAGSLKSSSSTKPWELHAATALTGEGPAPHHATLHDAPLAPPPIQRQPSPMSATAAVHNPRIQSVHYAPGQSPVYQQSDDMEPSDTARVVHLQYQSPLGLYSKENAQVALDAQTKGKPGEGTLAVMGVNEAEAMQSDVYKMVHENDNRQPHHAPGGGGVAYHQPQPHAQPAYDMNAGYGGGMEDGLGASDF